MDIQVLSEDNCPVLQIDNFFDAYEQDNIWRELEYYDRGRYWDYDPRDPNRATDETGISLGRLGRIYLDGVYTPEQRRFSPVLTHHMKIYSDPVTEAYTNMCPAGRTIEDIDQDKTFLSYYADQDEYRPHQDGCIHTALIYFHREPKGFEGGDLTFEDSGITVECKHNRLVLFPSYYTHTASKVSCAYGDYGAGKYTITVFLWKTPPKPMVYPWPPVVNGETFMGPHTE